MQGRKIKPSRHSRLEARRVEAGLQGERCGCMWVLRSKSVEELPSVPEVVHLDLRISKKNRNDPNDILRGFGDDDS